MSSFYLKGGKGISKTELRTSTNNAELAVVHSFEAWRRDPSAENWNLNEFNMRVYQNLKRNARMEFDEGCNPLGTYRVPQMLALL